MINATEFYARDFASSWWFPAESIKLSARDSCPITGIDRRDVCHTVFFVHFLLVFIFFFFFYPFADKKKITPCCMQNCLTRFIFWLTRRLDGKKIAVTVSWKQPIEKANDDVLKFTECIRSTLDIGLHFYSFGTIIKLKSCMFYPMISRLSYKRFDCKVNRYSERKVRDFKYTTR